MSKRTINIDNGTSPQPGPQTMNELLNSAEVAWKLGKKTEGFITLLGAMAFMSQGVATAMKESAELHRELADIKAKLAEKE